MDIPCDDGFPRDEPCFDVVEYNPDRKRVAAAGTGVRVWTGVEKGWRLLTDAKGNRAQSNGIQHMRFTASGDKLVTVANDNSLCAWDVVDGTLLHRWVLLSDGPGACDHQIAISDSGETLAVSCAHVLQTCNIITGVWGWSKRLETGSNIKSIAFSPDGLYVVVATHLKCIVLGAEKGKIISDLPWTYAVAEDATMHVCVTVAAHKIAMISSAPSGRVTVRPMTGEKRDDVFIQYHHLFFQGIHFVTDDIISLHTNFRMFTVDLKNTAEAQDYPRITANMQRCACHAVDSAGSLWIVGLDSFLPNHTRSIHIRCVIDAFDVDAAFGDMKNAGKTS